jgi:hypothetical protein
MISFHTEENFIKTHIFLQVVKDNSKFFIRDNLIWKSMDFVVFISRSICEPIY